MQDGMKTLNNGACGRAAILAESAEAGRFELAIRLDARLTRTASARLEHPMETAGTTSRLRQHMARQKSRMDGKSEALGLRVEAQFSEFPDGWASCANAWRT